MLAAGQVVTGIDSVIGTLFLHILFRWLAITRWVWKYIIDPRLCS